MSVGSRLEANLVRSLQGALNTGEIRELQLLVRDAVRLVVFAGRPGPPALPLHGSSRRRGTRRFIRRRLAGELLPQCAGGLALCNPVCVRVMRSVLREGFLLARRRCAGPAALGNARPCCLGRLSRLGARRLEEAVVCCASGPQGCRAVLVSVHWPRYPIAGQQRMHRRGIAAPAAGASRGRSPRNSDDC
jgi:hypothetical protein